jgi:type II secretory pathway pseudopilin PulG
MTSTDATVFTLLAVIAGIVGGMSWGAVRRARRAERASATVSAQEVRAAAASEVRGQGYLYSLLQGRLSAGTWTQRIHADDGTLITEVTTPTLPRHGVLQTFDLDGRTYQCVSERLLGRRVVLRDAQSGEVPLSVEHSSLRVRFYRGRSDELMFEVKVGTVLTGDSTVQLHGLEVARLLDVNLAHCQARLLTPADPGLSRLAQCFLLARMPGGG